jgi:peptide/nickel transport system permease protein
VKRIPEHLATRASVAVLGALAFVAVAGTPVAGALFGRESLPFAWAAGARSTLAAASIVMVLSFVGGVLVGALAALGPSLSNTFLARAMEIAGALPSFAAVVVVRAVFPAAELMAVAMVLSALRLLSTAKLVRAELLALRAEEFVVAAQALGSTRTRLFRSHLFPYIAGPSLADAAHAAAAVVALDAALALAGFGTSETTWGTLFARGVEAASVGAAIVPALGVAVTVGALLVVAEAVEDGWAVGRRFV